MPSALSMPSVSVDPLVCCSLALYMLYVECVNSLLRHIWRQATSGVVGVLSQGFANAFGSYALVKGIFAPLHI